MRLNYEQAMQRAEQMQGAWLLHGDELLLTQNLLAQIRNSWQHQKLERQRIDIQQPQDWQHVFSELNSLSLFSSANVLEVHSSIRPDNQQLKKLEHFIASPQQNKLVIVMPKQDSKAQKQRFYQLLNANATIVQLSLPTIDQQTKILQTEANKLKLELNKEAWQFIVEQHQNNLIAAKNSLVKLADQYHDSAQLSLEQVKALIDQSRHSLFDLSDQCLLGNLENSIKILKFLLETGEAPSLIFWTLSKDMRQLLQLFEQPNQAQALGIWSSRQRLFFQALKRIEPSQRQSWSQLILQTDASIKGLDTAAVQHRLFQLVAVFCGRPLWTN